MSRSRKKRRADGSLRPTIARRRAQNSGRGFLDDEIVERFRQLTVTGTLVWNAHPTRERLGSLTVEELGARLEKLAREHRWAKLRDTAGTVRAIGLPVNHPERGASKPFRHCVEMTSRLFDGAAA